MILTEDQEKHGFHLPQNLHPFCSLHDAEHHLSALTTCDHVLGFLLTISGFSNEGFIKGFLPANSRFEDQGLQIKALCSQFLDHVF